MPTPTSPKPRLSLAERAAQLRAQAATLEAKARKAERKSAVDLRNCQARQIGYWVLDQLQKRGNPIPEIRTWEDLVANLSGYLVADAHRGYFDLAPLPKKPEV